MPGSAITATLSPPVAASGLEVRGVEKTYGSDVRALRSVDLRAEEGEFVTLLGPSGSGKTTLLMIIGGFDSPTQGSIRHNGSDITCVPPQRRNFGVVFQNYALFPHMTAKRNVEYPLAARRVQRSERQAMVDRAMALVGLEGLEQRRPAELSGGQQQRVALARALVYQPSVLLLDEPLGALDRALRERMQAELRRLHDETGATFLYVTHDQEEAMTMSDRIVVLRDGQIEQIGTPTELYQCPATRFVAGFLGVANEMSGTVVSVSGDFAEIELPFGRPVAVPCRTNSLRPGELAHVIVRPENVRFAGNREEQTSDLALDGVLDDVAFTGSVWRYRARTAVGPVYVVRTSPSAAPVGQAVSLHWLARDCWAIRVEPPSTETASHYSP